MSEYQRKESRYILPRNLYMATLYQIRDYYRMKQEAEAALTASPEPPDGQPRGTAIGNTVESAAIRREKYVLMVKIVDEALEEIPEEYRRGVWRNIMNGEPYPDDASRNTYGNHKSRFIYEVAKKIYLLD